MKVEVYPNSTLYKDGEEMEALSLGSVQLLAPSLAKFGPLGARDFEVFDLPYIFDNYEELHKGTGGEAGKAGKAFGVNGGFVAGRPELIEAVRQKADTYIYTNPLGAADCAAPVAAVEIADGPEGRERLANLAARTRQFRQGLDALGLESIPGPHPVVPLLVRSTDKVRAIVRGLFERRILAVGLTFPVVPKGDETIRFQVNAAHTAADIDEVLESLRDLAQ